MFTVDLVDENRSPGAGILQNNFHKTKENVQS